MTRCDDCLDDLGPVRFVVLKRRREWRNGLDAEQLSAPEAAMCEALCWDEADICHDCAGWYGDDALAVEDDDAIFDALQEVRRDIVSQEDPRP